MHYLVLHATLHRTTRTVLVTPAHFERYGENPADYFLGCAQDAKVIGTVGLTGRTVELPSVLIDAT